MPEEQDVTISLCNASGAEMLVWLEPWAQEFELPARATLMLHCRAENVGVDPAPELVVGDSLVTVYGAGGTRIAVFVDGRDRDSFSANHTAPSAGPLTTRGFVDLVFGSFAEARPGGRPLPSEPGRSGWLDHLSSFLRR